MERIAVLSDVHGNITALNAVLDDIRKRGISNIYCLGDSVTKCVNPDLVIDTLRANCKVILKGNCDEVIARPDIQPGRFWSRDKIGEERANFLRNLPISYEFYLSGYLIRLFHASPFALDYIFNPMFANRENAYSEREIISPLKLFENTKLIGKTANDPIPDIVGYGHIHTPNLFRFKNKTIFNPGSVGIPIEMENKDFDDPTNKFSTLSSYMILEGELDSKELSSISFSLVRIKYDIQKEIEYLQKSDMANKDEIITNLLTATNV